jgi:hypothetical protein
MTNLRYSVSSFEKTYSFLSKSLSNTTDVKKKDELNKSFRLNYNYPNPFNGSTKIIFSLENTCFVSLTVYDVLGREVERLTNEILSVGQHTFDFVPRQEITTGVYFYRLNTNGYSQTNKMIYLR